MSKAFDERGVESPRLSAEMLLAHVLGCDRLRLYMNADRPASQAERDQLRALVSRALTHEPVQYLVGEAWFFSLPFTVDRRVLIPRPSTETIVEHVLQETRKRADQAPPQVIADVCTGSGCIAVVLARNLAAARVLATDISGEALDVARANAARHAVADRITFLQGDLLEPLRRSPTPPLGFLVANPPYIPDHEWHDPAMMGRNVKGHEPELALRGGADGLRLVEPMIDQSAEFLAPGGRLLIELAASTAEAALARAVANPQWSEARILMDADGLPRVLSAVRRA